MLYYAKYIKDEVLCLPILVMTAVDHAHVQIFVFFTGSHLTIYIEIFTTNRNKINSIHTLHSMLFHLLQYRRD